MKLKINSQNLKKIIDKYLRKECFLQKRIILFVRKMDLLIQLIKKNLLIAQITFLFFSEKKNRNFNPKKSYYLSIPKQFLYFFQINITHSCIIYKTHYSSVELGPNNPFKLLIVIYLILVSPQILCFAYSPHLRACLTQIDQRNHT